MTIDVLQFPVILFRNDEVIAYAVADALSSVPGGKDQSFGYFKGMIIIDSSCKAYHIVDATQQAITPKKRIYGLYEYRVTFQLDDTHEILAFADVKKRVLHHIKRDSITMDEMVGVDDYLFHLSRSTTINELLSVLLYWPEYNQLVFTEVTQDESFSRSQRKPTDTEYHEHIKQKNSLSLGCSLFIALIIAFGFWCFVFVVSIIVSDPKGTLHNFPNPVFLISIFAIFVTASVYATVLYRRKTAKPFQAVEIWRCKPSDYIRLSKQHDCFLEYIIQLGSDRLLYLSLFKEKTPASIKQRFPTEEFLLVISPDNRSILSINMSGETLKPSPNTKHSIRPKYFPINPVIIPGSLHDIS